MVSSNHSKDKTSTKSFDNEWSQAHPTVLKLLHQKSVTPREWQDIFLNIYNIHSWVDNGKEHVRNALIADFQQYINDTHKRIKDSELLLEAYIAEWKKFYTQTGILPLPFRMIETNESKHSGFQSYSASRQEAQVLPIRETMLNFWNKEIFCASDDKLLTRVESLLEDERNGIHIESSLVVGIRESYVALSEPDIFFSSTAADEKLDNYKRTFEKRYIDLTVNYYKQRAAEFLEQNGVINYMFYADRKLEEEENRGRVYLDPNPESLLRLVEACVGVLVGEFLDQILVVCTSLVQHNDVEKLRMLYRLVKRTPKGIDTILKCIDEHIRTEGLNDMKTNAEIITTDPEKYIGQLLGMFNRFSLLIKEGFYDDARLLTARDKAFHEIVNDTTIFRLELPQSKKGRGVSFESKCPELLANYCDLLLRKTQLSKKLASEEIDEKLNNLLLVLKYVANKDVFMRFHKAHLSRRLILDMSADQEKEETMVTKLRECGMPAEHVNKLSRMLQDIEVSKDLNSDFKKSLMGNKSKFSDMANIKVLNGGAWGRNTGKMHVSLPREMEELVPEVEAFYKKQHSGRKLSWMHHWSSGSMIFGTKNGGKFDLDVTTFQMAVLFAFNDRAHEKLSFETLRVATELPDSELSRTLLSLVAYPKLKSQLLLCDITSKPINVQDFTDSTLFYINHSFHLIKNGKEQMRGRLNLIGRLQLSIESSATKEHEDIVALREFRVQEAAVKIMKMRKTITSAQLQTELVEILKPMFLPSRRLIKEQIDWLIENRFMARKDDDMNMFVYLS